MSMPQEFKEVWHVKHISPSRAYRVVERACRWYEQEHPLTYDSTNLVEIVLVKEGLFETGPPDYFGERAFIPGEIILGIYRRNKDKD